MYDPLTHDAHISALAEEAIAHNIESEEFTNAAKNLRLFVEIGPLLPEPKPQPTTRWSKVKAAVAPVLAHDNMGIFLKAGGSLVGVWLVVHSTIHRDHVLERDALAQANQRPS